MRLEKYNWIVRFTRSICKGKKGTVQKQEEAMEKTNFSTTIRRLRDFEVVWDIYFLEHGR